MGGAASARRKGSPQEHDARARWNPDKNGRGRQRRGDEAAEGVDESLLKERLLQDPSRRRRRKVLFGGGGGEVAFDRVTPQDQFHAHPQDDDLVYRRCGGLEVFNDFRGKAQDIRYSKSYDNGFLEENAIELLGLDLGETWLKTRLFKMAQVQEVMPPPGEKPEPRIEKLTCYELLALYSVFRFGERSELLELLFCVSDADGDDRVSVADLAMFITTFLGLPQGVDKEISQMDEHELQDFARLGGKALKSEATLMAKKAVKDFGSKDLGDEEDSDAPVSDDDDQGSDTSVSSKKANPGRGGDKKPAGRRGLCQGKQPADTDTEDEERSRSRSKASSAGKREKKSKGGCLGGGGRSRGPPALNYEQWRKWLAQSDLLPPEWAEALDVTLATVESPAAEFRADEVRTDPLDPAPLDSGSEGGDDSPSPRGRGAPPPTGTRPLLMASR